MTFFYDLNKKIADLAKPAEQLNERSEKWIQKAVDPSHKGDLHKALHVPQGEKIPKGKIEKATHSKNAHLPRKYRSASSSRNPRDCSVQLLLAGSISSAIRRRRCAARF